MKYLLFTCITVLLCGCWETREEARTVTTEKTTGTSAGQAISTTTVRETVARTQTQSGVDAQAIGAAVAEATKAALAGIVPGVDAIGKAVSAAIPAQGGMDWTQIIAAAGTAITSAATGTLVLHEQRKRKERDPAKAK